MYTSEDKGNHLKSNKYQSALRCMLCFLSKINILTFRIVESIENQQKCIQDKTREINSNGRHQNLFCVACFASTIKNILISGISKSIQINRNESEATESN